MTPPKKVGGEIGEVRSAIDIEKLNAYIEAHVPVIKALVAVKQFKQSVSENTEERRRRLRVSTATMYN